MTVWLIFLGLSFATWVLVLTGTSGGQMAMGGVAPVLFLVWWVPMTAAMMVPAVAPAATLWMRAVARRCPAPVVWARAGAFLSGYLVAWAGYGLLALVAVHWVTRAAGAAGSTGAAWIAAAIFAAAGLYQMTPLKDRCLRRCRSPLGQVLRWAGLRGGAVDFRAGLSNGMWCVACCWALMAVLLVTGTMNIAAMAALAAAVFAEKVSRHGKIAARVSGVALIVAAALVPVAPWLAPGLRLMPGGPM